MIGNYSNLTLEKLVVEIKNSLDYSRATRDSFKKEYNQFIKKYPPDKEGAFHLSIDTSIAINHTLELMDAVEELSRELPSIILKNFTSQVSERFKQIGNSAYDLYLYHRKSFHENEEAWNNVRRLLPSKDAELVYKWFYAKLSDYINNTKTFHDYGVSLERFAKFPITQRIRNRRNSFQVKALKNIDATEDFTQEVVEYKFGRFTLYDDNRVLYETKEFNLEPKQWQLLRIFLEYSGQLLSIYAIEHLLNNNDNIENIKKYIPKLQKTLKQEVGRAFITNTREKGWTFSL